MNEPPGARMRVGLSGLTMAEYFRDQEGQDVLLFIDNIFRFTQAGSEVSALLGRMPSAVGYQPTLAGRDGGVAGADHLHQAGFDHLGAGGVRAGGRPDRPGSRHHLRPSGRDHGAQPARSRRWASTRRWTRWSRVPGFCLPTSWGGSTTRRPGRCRPRCSGIKNCRISSRFWGWTN